VLYASRASDFFYALKKERGYQSLAENLVKFDELGKLPRTLQLGRLNERQGIEATLVTIKAKWHKTCRFRYNNQMLQRTKKREHQSPERNDAPHKSIRLQSSLEPSEALCFFCGKKLVVMAYMK